MKDTYDDEIILDRNTDASAHSPLFLRCTSQQGGEAAGMGLDAKKARKLAKKLLAAADELDDAQGRDLGPKHEQITALLAVLGAQRELQEVELKAQAGADS